MIVSAYLLRYDGKNAYRIWQRDRRNHKSPNSAQTESACAGALGLRLAGDAWYFGKLVPKPYIGDEIHPIEPQDIRRVNRLMYGRRESWDFGTGDAGRDFVLIKGILTKENH